MQSLRVLFDPPASGEWNMAVDETLLESAAALGLATLRFYTWEVPTLSLGYFQSADDRRQHLASLNCPLVRRASGGGAIVHDRELTYSIALPQTTNRASDATELYNVLHETLVETLAEFGVPAELFCSKVGQRGPSLACTASEPFLCFDRRASGDVILGAAKIAGSAQRRRRGAVLQHGSILLANSAAAPHLAGIAELSGPRIVPGELARRWQQRIIAKLHFTAASQSLTEIEQNRAAALCRTRFGSLDFAARR